MVKGHNLRQDADGEESKARVLDLGKDGQLEVWVRLSQPRYRKQEQGSVSIRTSLSFATTATDKECSMESGYRVYLRCVRQVHMQHCKKYS